MRTAHVCVDFHAHITHLASTVELVNRFPVARIRFHNLGFGTITAVKLQAFGFNAFGEPVLVGGKETFRILLQDLCVAPNTDYSDGMISLPNAEIRRLCLQEEQVCFSDGTIYTYPGASSYECEIEMLDPLMEEEAQRLEILRDYEKTAICLPQMTEEHWVCVCGQVNQPNSAACRNCLHRKDEMDGKFTDAFFSAGIEKKRAAEQAQYQQNRIKKQKKAAVISLVAVLICVFLGLTVSGMILSDRMTFSTEEEMWETLDGTWQKSSGDFSGIEYRFSDDGRVEVRLCMELSSGNHTGSWDDFTSIAEFHPRLGYIKVGNSKLIVRSSYRIQEEDTSYYKK